MNSDVYDKNGKEIKLGEVVKYEGKERVVVFRAGSFRLSPDVYGESITHSDKIEVLCDK